MASITPAEFVRKWRGDTRKERSVSQEHFIDLCRMLGHETPGENRDGTLLFEAGADKLSGGQGWADVWKKGVFAWEYKGPRANLDKAYQQLQQYRDSLQNPPLLVVSDIQSIIIHTNFVNTVKQTTTLTLDDLQTPAGLQTLRLVFTNPEALRPTTTTAQVTEAAAAEVGKLAEQLRRYGEKPQRIAHFLIRLVFCLFAEDTGLLPHGLFTRIVSQTRHRGPAFVAQMQDLFDKMATGGFFGTDEIKHFNGGLFEDNSVIALDSDSLAILERVAQLDWASIEPSIFGTLFERSLDPSKRAQLGAHYTSRDDIMLIVEPVVMAPLRRRWQTVQAEARDLAAQRDAAPAGPRRNQLENRLSRLLQSFTDELAGMRVLDPACGSGNFLYVALRQLLDLELEVINVGAELGLTRMLSVVGPEQLHGIEINEYAHELAQVTVWIGYLQWLRDNGLGQPAEPILQPLDTIKHMDAILAFDADGKPYEPEWPAADVIIGNPPFLGDKKMRGELGDRYVETLRTLYQGRVPGGADLVTYWFERARALIEQGQVQRAGLLATQGVRGIANRFVLEQIKKTGDIFMAWSDRAWVQNGAAVRVAMVGFDNGSEIYRTLDGYSVETINTDLSTSIDVTSAVVLKENIGLCYLGMMKAGPFDLDGMTARKMLNSVNLNGYSNSDVIKRRLGGQDVVGRARDAWIIDFGVDTTEEEASNYGVPFDYVKTHVKPLRDINRRETMKKRWWIHGEPRRGLRAAIRSGKLKRCIVTPEVSKYRIFVWMDTTIIPDHKLHVFARDDDYFFGVLQSRVHEQWSLAQCSWLGVGNDPSYSSSRTFETYPFPWPPGHEPHGDALVEAIAEAARALVAWRDAWLNPPGLPEAELKKRTLTNLYNQRPPELAVLHNALDQAVFAAYGWPSDLSDEQILERLLALNLERAALGGAASIIEQAPDQAEE